MILFTATLVALCESFPVGDITDEKCDITDNGIILNCTSRGLTEPPNITNASDILEIYLTNNQITNLPVEIFKTVTNLEYLDIQNNEITSISLGLFDELNKLRYLLLASNKITSLPLRLFDELVNLLYLELENNEITILPLGLFDALKKIQYLSIANNDITSLTVGLFDFLFKLEILSLKDNRLSSLPVEILAYLGSLKELSLPVLCNCTENQLHIMPFILIAPFTTSIFNNNNTNIIFEWFYLTNNCNSACIDEPFCTQVQACIDEESTSYSSAQLISTGAPFMDMTESTSHPSVQLISNWPPSMDTAGIIYTTIASIVGAIVSTVTLLTVYSMIHTTAGIFKTKTVTENQMEDMIHDLLSMDYEHADEGAKCRNVPPISYQEMVFHM